MDSLEIVGNNLSDEELRFCAAYVGAARESAVEAYLMSHAVERGRSRATISRAANLVLRRPGVANWINQAKTKTVERATQETLYGVMEVLRDLTGLLTADPAELMQVRHQACRHCHGKDHAYQWRDAEEFADAVASVIAANAAASHKSKHKKIPVNKGGFGFNPTIRPHPKCPRCYGEGHTVTWFADTRDLSPQARMLFDGVKQTKDGMQVLVRSRDKARDDLMRALGMLQERLPYQPGDPRAPNNGNANGLPIISDDAVAASRAYAEWIQNN